MSDNPVKWDKPREGELSISEGWAARLADPDWKGWSDKDRDYFRSTNRSARGTSAPVQAGPAARTVSR